MTILKSNALTTLALIKSDLGITVATYDTLLEGLINAASDAIEQRCGRVFQYSTVTEKIAGKGTELMCLSRTPIDTTKAVTVKWWGTTLDSTNYEVQDAEAGLLRNLWGSWWWDACTLPNATQDALPGTERKLYEVTYYGGYVLPNDTGTRTLPYDLELACRTLVAQYYRGLGRDPSVSSERLLSASVSYINGAGEDGWPPLVRSIVKNYERIS